MIRLNKYLSQNGLCSRRSADKLILSGKISVNGKKINELGLKIDEDKDIVTMDGREIDKVEQVVYYALNKPTGYLATTNDPRDRKKVTDLVPSYPRVYPVGRLDYDSEGLILLTNNGDFSYKMIHPKFEKEKEYLVRAEIRNLKVESIENLYDLFLNGIRLKEGVAKADKFEITKTSSNKIEFKIVLHQGWNRQIRRMCATVGLDVITLKRIRIGKLLLGNIKPGDYKKLNEKEIKNI